MSFSGMHAARRDRFRGKESMKPPEFSPDLLLGIDDIDRQHRELFAQAARALAAGPGGVDERRLLDFFVGYIHYHFDAEESVMKNAGIDPRKHALQHQRLRAEVEALSRMRREAAALGEPGKARLRVLVEDWLTNHIRTWDAQLAASLRALGGQHVLPLPGELAGQPAEGVRPEEVEVVDIGREIGLYEIEARRKRWK
jgi:hemerythrin